jgi:hypothetical protein
MRLNNTEHTQLNLYMIAPINLYMRKYYKIE